MTNSRSSLKLTSIESVMPSSHLILCRPLLLLPPIPPSIRVFSNESSLHVGWPKYWSFSFSIIPSREHITPVHFNHSAYNCEQIKFLLQNIHDNASLNVQLLQKEIFETVSKCLPSSTNLETLAEQLGDQLSGLDPSRMVSKHSPQHRVWNCNFGNCLDNYICHLPLPSCKNC